MKKHAGGKSEKGRMQTPANAFRTMSKRYRTAGMNARANTTQQQTGTHALRTATMRRLHQLRLSSYSRSAAQKQGQFCVVRALRQDEIPGAD
ncbi:hypothetical protein [Herbaspirillum sp. alder98]|uniref:hypothetical protein n=1 Tax=Herbaspirillum sp. alder98 TaxID=2913096 RepID=UPI001CD85907|nr:hypothetical protein [Herbaspirillum sp. alder98]MCA1325631.1 hypothetical protein [Herbaspirillum sp. alder98]